MRPSTRRPRGFTLVEAAVAICVMAILAGMITPLVLKVLNQQREAKTRESLKVAFEGMFGAKDRRLANMLSDFGFAPTSSLTNLSAMIARPSSGTWSTVPGYAQDTTLGLFWGYNGPYWNGSALAGNPVDAWGKAFRLRVVGTSPNQTWQVYSLGVNGIDESAGGDDLVYPAVPTLASTYESVLNFNIANPNSRTISVTAYSRQGSASLSTITSGPFTSSSIPTQVYNPWSGGIAIRITVTGASPATYYYVVDLLPGEVRDFSVTVP